MPDCDCCRGSSIFYASCCRGNRYEQKHSGAQRLSSDFDRAAFSRGEKEDDKIRKDGTRKMREFRRG